MLLDFGLRREGPEVSTAPDRNVLPTRPSGLGPDVFFDFRLKQGRGFFPQNYGVPETLEGPSGSRKDSDGPELVEPFCFNSVIEENLCLERSFCPKVPEGRDGPTARWSSETACGSSARDPRTVDENLDSKDAATRSLVWWLRVREGEVERERGSETVTGY